MDESASLMELAVSLARMEGKIDAYSARTSQVEDRLNEHDARLRTSATADEVADLDKRLRAQENKSVVTPAALAASLTLVIGAVSAAAAYIK